MAKIDGNYFRVKKNTVDIGATTSVSFSISKDFQETTNQDDAGNITYHPTAGKIGVTGSFDGFYDPDLTLGAEEIIDLLLNNSGFSTIQVGQMGASNKDGVYYQFQGLFKDLSIDAKNDSVPTIKGSFMSSGAIVKKISTGSAGS